jgi:hypothetical protein
MNRKTVSTPPAQLEIIYTHELESLLQLRKKSVLLLASFFRGQPFRGNECMSEQRCRHLARSSRMQEHRYGYTSTTQFPRRSVLSPTSTLDEAQNIHAHEF